MVVPVFTSRSIATRSALGAFCILLAVPSAAAQTVRLNDPLPAQRGSVLSDYEVSPDGTRVVYRTDPDSTNRVELFAAPIDGSALPVRLHAPLGPNGRVEAFACGGQGRVAFRANLFGSLEVLYSSPIDGSSLPVRLSEGVLTNEDVASLALTPDGQRVIFRGIDRLYSAPIDGSAPATFLDDLVTTYQITPDGAAVVYAVEVDRKEELYRIPVDGSGAPQLLGNSIAPTQVLTYFDSVRFDADGLHGAFVAVDALPDFGDIEIGSLFSFTLDASHPQVLLQKNDVNLEKFEYATAGARVLFRKPGGTLHTVRSDGTGLQLLDSDVSVFDLAPDLQQVAYVKGPATSTLRVVAADGSSAPRPLFSAAAIEAPRYSPSSDFVFFIATDPATRFRGLWAVAPAGGAPLLLNAPLVPGRGAVDFAQAPDGTLVYRETRAAEGLIELWSIGLDLQPRRLSGPLDGFRDVVSFRIAPAGGRLAYRADERFDQSFEVFGAKLDASEPAVVLSEPFLPFDVLGDVTAFQATPDGQRVVYTADQEVDSFFDVHATDSNGLGTPVRLGAPLVDDVDVDSTVVLDPTGARVVAVYRIPAAFNGSTFSLYSSHLSGTEPAHELDTVPVGGLFAQVKIDPTGTFAVYARTTNAPSLRRVDLAGASGPIVLHSLATGRDFLDVTPTLDGSAVIYRAETAAPGRYELFRVPSDGSAPPTLFHPPLTTGTVLESRLTADGSRVVYRATESGPRELYSVPSDGSAAPVKLNAPLANGVHVEGFELAAAAPLVFYRTGLEQLYAVPLDGSAPAVLIADLPTATLQPGLVLTPDGEFVFYRADALTAGRIELFALRTDASGPPVRLNQNLVAGGDVTDFALSRDRARIVYRADAQVDERYELFSVGPSGPPVPLIATMPSSADVSAFALDPTSRQVVFRANLDRQIRFELYRVPIEGGPAPERISLPLTGTSNVQADFLPLADRVLYRADATNGVFELFAFIDRRVRER